MICSWICNISRAPARPSHFRTTFVQLSIQFTIHLWKFVEGYHTTFVTVFIPLSSPFSYHLRSTRIFQPLVNQPIPKFPIFPNFPNFPNFPAFPNLPSFPAFPNLPKSSIHPCRPQKFMVYSMIIYGDIKTSELARLWRWGCATNLEFLFYNFSEAVILSAQHGVIFLRQGREDAVFFVILRKNTTNR